MTPTPGDGIPAAALADLQRLYARLETELRRLDLRCRACGRCCHFETAGHILFATALETAASGARQPPPPEPAGPMRCPWQVREACTAREGRPLGCRLHFCETTPETAAALEELSTRAHAELRRIHDAHGIDWDYRPFLRDRTSE
jgi:hypothetical protein